MVALVLLAVLGSMVTAAPTARQPAGPACMCYDAATQELLTWMRVISDIIGSKPPDSPRPNDEAMRLYAPLLVIALTLVSAQSELTTLDERAPTVERRNYCNRLSDCVAICDEVDIGRPFLPVKMTGILPNIMASIYLDTVPLEALDQPGSAVPVLRLCCKIHVTIDVEIGFTRRYWKLNVMSSKMKCDWQNDPDAATRQACSEMMPPRDVEAGCALPTDKCKIVQYMTTDGHCTDKPSPIVQ
ncbi:uncharacterized protein L969DRAFT_97256 [Mixia osmundae IAM 14324]|uniref:Hydrophobin n=1 Tax=Mixia osmundae (strain CBS 9802 / IAM 14324 / JCM 22182 / KY 12970) TaxID=764103 RepID=G7DW92_MIXOS|nr:uncharacterized protein L969DRAFT_97256 [Mixia osmundae IAM 14324]KEI36521.1 hypothetical protein L969DRAFT_97256 [Mixia osmundae IAM 14324]GAA94780.1 hypothetical protein E5Q_01434 [Mixia osmundae IAM 14324]